MRSRLFVGWRTKLLFGLLFGLSAKLIVHLSRGIDGRLLLNGSEELLDFLAAWLGYWLGSGLVFGLMTGFSIILVNGLGIVLSGGLALLIQVLSYNGLHLGGVTDGLLIGLLYQPERWVCSGIIWQRDYYKNCPPNEGLESIRRDGRGQWVGRRAGRRAALWARYRIGIWVSRRTAFGAAAAIHYGGRTCLQHLFVFRLGLCHNDSTPWQYVDFLDYAAERISLRKVGGGYSFYHRLLQEYFASLYPEPGAVQTPRYARRHPWIAGCLSCIIPGMGQIYNGQPAKGLLVYGLGLGGGLAALMMTLELPIPPWNIVILSS